MVRFNDWQKAEGSLHPPGATWVPAEKAWNFVISSKNASKVTLLLYAEDDVVQPIAVFPLDPYRNKSGPLWHCRIGGKHAAQARYYAYRVAGPLLEDGGFHCFDPEKILLDPYAKAVYFPPGFDRDAACRPGANDGKAPLGILLKDEKFDWHGDGRLQHGYNLIIYEMHVRGFTRSATSGLDPRKRGTFAGVIEKIPYLKELGVTAVELMPVFQFDPAERNYWGYMPLNFFAPHHVYASGGAGGEEQRREFREMVRALHDAEIEVILDVVFNHTAEGDADDPIYSYKGIDNSLYYLRSNDPSEPYANFSGCGNTLDVSSVFVRNLIIESLRYWREEMHVDGFRFDLASVFTRCSDGSIDSRRPPIFAQIRSAGDLAKVRLIAEPWDAGGAYQLGRAFPGWLWMQWNARYRDTLQRFVRGDGGMIGELMTRLYGSCDLFPDDPPSSCRPWQSVNYISSHDGSSLYDMVSFEGKYNLANGEDNRDGCFEYKWNCGHEGDSGVPPAVAELRRRQVKNFFCLLMLSNGTPMFRMGDEFCQTQGGNNNPYNQDNETSWLNWSLLDRNQEVFRFVKLMIAFRKTYKSISRSHFWRSNVAWFGTHGTPDFSENSRCLAFYLKGAPIGEADIYAMINADSHAHRFDIQAGRTGSWSRTIDTSLPAPQDITLPSGPPHPEAFYILPAHSVAVLTGPYHRSESSAGGSNM